MFVRYKITINYSKIHIIIPVNHSLDRAIKYADVARFPLEKD